MAHDPLIAVRDVLREIDFLDTLSARMAFEQFRVDATAVRAAAYSIQIISEAVRHVPEAWLAEFPSEPWAAIKATGNKIRHEYFRLDETILWAVVTTHSQSLKVVMESILEKHGGA